MGDDVFAVRTCGLAAQLVMDCDSDQVTLDLLRTVFALVRGAMAGRLARVPGDSAHVDIGRRRNRAWGVPGDPCGTRPGGRASLIDIVVSGCRMFVG